ncbi:MAG: FeoB-associated Cys-rich membrane protein [Clostridia bacterium]|nr:FeoB-associated Cys-rich membrane protein [Clostridia bacterium]
MGFFDYVILAIVLGLVVVAIVVNRKAKKEGKGCCGSCNSSCEHCKCCELDDKSKK